MSQTRQLLGSIDQNVYRQSEDDFGLSSSDEAELVKLEENCFKRKNSEGTSSSFKKPRHNSRDFAPAGHAKRVLKERFGLTSFRLKQEAAIERLLDGKNVAVVFPTGNYALYFCQGCAKMYL